jgi:porin
LDQSAHHVIAAQVTDRLALPISVESGHKDSTWAANYNFFHYAQVYKGGPQTWSPLMPTLRPKGWGFFARASMSDGNPNPIKWFASVGAGGDNPIRLKDSWGVGAYYQGMSDEKLMRDVDVGDEKGIEAWYNWGVTGWMNLTADVQYIAPGLPRAKDSVVLGLRLRVDF